MNEKIKHRIEQIKRGEVPSGYKKTKAGIMPLDWCCNKEYQAKDIFKSVTNKKHNGEYEVLSATQDRGVIPRSQVDIEIKYDEANIAGYKKVDKCDFVISLRSFQGGIEYSEYEGLVSPAYTVLKPILPISDGFYKAYFKTDDYIQRLNIGTYGIRDGKQIGYEDFGNMIIHYPSLAEQEKIAEILATQDKVIALKEKLLEEKKKQKKYLMQQLLTGKKRLPGFRGDWEKTRLSSIADFCFDSIDPSKHPNETFCVYSLPAFDNSMIPEILLGSEINSSKFKLNHGVILFNKLNVRQKRVWLVRGNLLPNSVSSTEFLPLIIHDICEEFLHYYLSSDSVVNFFIRKSSGTSNSQQRILPTDLMKLSVFTPPREEQIAIAKILSNTDKEISIIQKLIDQEKQRKKALMQLLLTGIVRV